MSDWITRFLEDNLNLQLTGSQIALWLLALAVVVIGFPLLKLILALVVKRLDRIAEQTRTPIDDALVALLKKTKWWLLLLLSLYGGSLFPEIPERGRGYLHSLFVIGLLVQLGVWANTLLSFFLDRYRQQQIKRDPAAVTALNALGILGRLLLWLAVALLILDNLGYNVTALIAGLGVGGVAVALAVQNILGDLFASMSILMDKPFVVGDFLIVGDYMGSVEHVGLKTTRIRSLSGEQLVFSNSDLLNSRLRNYGRMFERRVAFQIGVTYDTPREKIRQIPVILREAIEGQEKTRFDRAHFAKYGDYALNFETVYYVLSPDYNLYMDIQQAINLHLHERFEALGIDFAFPTQTLMLRQNPPKEWTEEKEAKTASD